MKTKINKWISGFAIMLILSIAVSIIFCLVGMRDIPFSTAVWIAFVINMSRLLIELIEAID